MGVLSASHTAFQPPQTSRTVAEASEKPNPLS
jgi:hypothetical protein